MALSDVWYGNGIARLGLVRHWFSSVEFCCIQQWYSLASSGNGLAQASFVVCGNGYDTFSIVKVLVGYGNARYSYGTAKLRSVLPW